MKTVVSANYKDRTDKVNRWLTRGVDEDLDKTIAQRRVLIEDFEFHRTTALETGQKGEDGFGCSSVCVGTLLDPEDSRFESNGELRQLKFEAPVGCFFDVETEEYILEGKFLLLRVDGSAFYIPNAPVAEA